MIIIRATMMCFRNITKLQELLKSKKPTKFLLYRAVKTPVTIKIKILILAIGVKRLVISFISPLIMGAGSKAAFALGNITKRIIIIPPIHIEEEAEDIG
jgi:hypothetical protein